MAKEDADSLMQVIQHGGRPPEYEFVFMPLDFQTQVVGGLAFGHFIAKIVVRTVWCHFDGLNG